MVTACTFDMMWWEWHFTSVIFLLQTYNLSLTIGKTSDRPKSKDMLQNTCPALLKTVKVNENRESLRNCHSLQEPKET